MSDAQGKTLLVTGRIVWTSGNLFKGKPKLDQTTRQQKLDKLGNPLTEYGFGLAVRAEDLGKPDSIWAAIHEQAYTLYPNRQVPPGFAWKYKEGCSNAAPHGIDDKGITFAKREGYEGHFVFACTTTIPIKFFKYEGGQHILINEGIKCGDYVTAQITVKAHPAMGQGKPGLYLNPNAVQLVGFGPEIINTPSGDQIFGQSQPALPPGASATPIAPAQFPNQAAPAQMGFAPPAMPPVAGMPPQGFNQAPPPHYGVVPPQHQPPMQQNTYQQPMQATQAPQQFAQPPMPQYGQPVYPPQGMPSPGQR